jgi:hypothetical protein
MRGAELFTLHGHSAGPITAGVALNMRISSDTQSQIFVGSEKEGSSTNSSLDQSSNTGLSGPGALMIGNSGRGVSFGEIRSSDHTPLANAPAEATPDSITNLFTLIKRMLDSLGTAELGQPDEFEIPQTFDALPPQSNIPGEGSQGIGKAGNIGEASALGCPQGTNLGNTEQVQSASSYEFLDNCKYSAPEDLKKFEPMVANLPADAQEQAEKELNRPIAAAKLAAEGGEFAPQAKAFIDANPAMAAAADVGKHGGQADGKTTDGDYKALAENLEKARDAGAKDVSQYRKDHPDADPQSLHMVISAALLRANEPIIKCAAPKQATADDERVDKFTDTEDLKSLGNNPGLSGLLKNSATMFSQPGFSDLLDQGGMEGKELAKKSADGNISSRNIDEWIKKQAPTNGGEFAKMMSSAATLNATAGVDISSLNEDVFHNADAYSGQQKAAVMVKLQKTLESVQAGQDLRKTDKTQTALQDKIAQLQGDKDVQEFLNQAIPTNEATLIDSDPALRETVNKRYESLSTGSALDRDMQADRDAASKDKDGKPIKNLKTPDYSGSLVSLSAELRLQSDLRGPTGKVPSASQIIAGREDLSTELQRSYLVNFAQGGKINEGMREGGAKPGEVLSDVDQQKAAYDAVLPREITQVSQDAYTDAMLAALKTTKAGVNMIRGFKDATAGLGNKDPMDITAQDLKAAADKRATTALDAKDAAGAGLRAAGGIYAMTSVSSLLAQGKDADASKAIYDSVRGGGTAARVGYDVATKASHTGGEIAGKVAGRAVGAIAGRVAGMAAADAVASAVPVVGWIADAAMSIGFGIKAIIDAVHKKQDQKAFDHNVDPTLNQFGIPKAH